LVFVVWGNKDPVDRREGRAVFVQTRKTKHKSEKKKKTTGQEQKKEKNKSYDHEWTLWGCGVKKVRWVARARFGDQIGKKTRQRTVMGNQNTNTLKGGGYKRLVLRPRRHGLSGKRKYRPQ